MNYLQQLARSRNNGAPIGIFSVCSAHPWVIEAAVDQALEDNTPLLIEATCNQVNQEGGYTGMVPMDFRNLVEGIALRKGLPQSRLILGGDHLGPNPWKALAPDVAMRAAELMVRAYVKAGFQKIHLDTSMSLAGDPVPLSNEVIAHRAARLCAAAEDEAGGVKPVYVIGTEVPVPGGASESLHDIVVTSRESAAETLAVHHRIFAEWGLAEVLPRVIALVVQPGVEFDHTRVIDYRPELSSGLTALLQEEKGLVFEAHSTDYQRPEALAALVQNGFAILKVGPALTFAMREALAGLAAIESELVRDESCSHLMRTIEESMLANSQNWAPYYNGGPQMLHLLRRYSYSDRVRYYWNDASVKQALETLCRNLEQHPILETLLSAFLPEEYAAVRCGKLQAQPIQIVQHRIRQVLASYTQACRSTVCTA